MGKKIILYHRSAKLLSRVVALHKEREAKIGTFFPSSLVNELTFLFFVCVFFGGVINKNN